MIDIVIPTLRKTRTYSDGEHVMLHVLQESIAATTEEYQVNVYDDDNPYLVKLDRALAESSNDVLVLDDSSYCFAEGWSEWLRAFLNARPQAAMVCSKRYAPAVVDGEELSYEPGVLLDAGTDIMPNGMTHCPHSGHPDPGCYNVPRQVAYAGFSGTLYRREFIDTCGGLDLEMIVGDQWSDVELSLRAWQQGWEVWCVPQSSIICYTEVELQDSDRIALNRDHVLAKYDGFWQHIARMTTSVVPRY